MSGQTTDGARGWERAEADRYWTWTWLTAGTGGHSRGGRRLAEADLHRLHHLGARDPLGAGTRAARYAALGQWRAAWRHNRLGPIAVLMGALMVLRDAVGRAPRRWWTPVVPASPGLRRLLVAALLVGWCPLDLLVVR